MLYHLSYVSQFFYSCFYLPTEISAFSKTRSHPSTFTVRVPSRARKKMERETGFEPATPSLEGWCSSQLSYSRFLSLPPPHSGLWCDAPPPGWISLFSFHFISSQLFHIQAGVSGGGRRIRTSVGQRPADLQSAPFNRFGIPPDSCYAGNAPHSLLR